MRERGMLCLRLVKRRLTQLVFGVHTNNDDETLAADDIQGLALKVRDVIVCAHVQQS
jgi:hypothetical protein